MLHCTGSMTVPTVIARKPANRSASSAWRPARSPRCRWRPSTVTSATIPDGPGHFVAPTVVTGLPRGHRLTREELFAPVVTVTAVDGIDDALAEANAVEYGLSAGIFSAVEDETDRFLDEIQAG